MAYEIDTAETEFEHENRQVEDDYQEPALVLAPRRSDSAAPIITGRTAMKAPLLGFAVALGLLALPASASAATCSSYDNQADAQRAADTRDADGDGVYCEALPCPCARPGTSGGGDDRDRSSRSSPRRTIKARISRVIDGDTVRVKTPDGRYYTVRLIGVDTPETKRPGVGVECGGPVATHYMLHLAFTRPKDTDGDGLFDKHGGTGRAVWVRTDPSQDTYDRYQRLLAYVTTRSRPKNLALEQIRAGLGKAYVYERRFAQYSRFKSSERTARQRDRGVWGGWGGCGGDFHSAQ